MKSSRIIVTLAVAALVLTGCAAGNDAPTSDSIVGTWGDTADTQPYLTLDEEGTLSGSDGCNNLVGSWTLDDSTLTFGPLGSTRMMCEGIDTWLADGVTGTISGDTLTVLDSDGETIGTLTRDS